MNRDGGVDQQGRAGKRPRKQARNGVEGELGHDGCLCQTREEDQQCGHMDVEDQRGAAIQLVQVEKREHDGEYDQQHRNANGWFAACRPNEMEHNRPLPSCTHSYKNTQNSARTERKMVTWQNKAANSVLNVFRARHQRFHVIARCFCRDIFVGTGVRIVIGGFGCFPLVFDGHVVVRLETVCVKHDQQENAQRVEKHRNVDEEDCQRTAEQIRVREKQQPVEK